MMHSLGFIIGTYVFTRMVSLMLRKGERKEPLVVIICAIITALISAIVLFDIITQMGTK